MHDAFTSFFLKCLERLKVKLYWSILRPKMAVRYDAYLMVFTLKTYSRIRQVSILQALSFTEQFQLLFTVSFCDKLKNSICRGWRGRTMRVFWVIDPRLKSSSLICIYSSLFYLQHHMSSTTASFSNKVSDRLIYDTVIVYKFTHIL